MDLVRDPLQNIEKVQRGRGRPKHPVKSLQMLDLDTANPLVAYNDQVYDCSWTDMVGTNMFFDMPSGTSSARPWLSDKDLTLSGTSRIKLVGHRAKLSKADSQRESMAKWERTRRQMGEVCLASSLATLRTTSTPRSRQTFWKD